MNLLSRLKADLFVVNQLMEINQSLSTKKERQKMGFHLLYVLRQDLRWAIQDLEKIY